LKKYQKTNSFFILTCKGTKRKKKKKKKKKTKQNTTQHQGQLKISFFFSLSLQHSFIVKLNSQAKNKKRYIQSPTTQEDSLRAGV